METSILNNTKKMLGIPAEDTSFDVDVILHINAAFSILNGLGVGPDAGFSIDDDDAVWDDFISADDEAMLNLIKTCVYLRVRLLFDPPATSFTIAALEKQLQEHEWRINERREQTDYIDPETGLVTPIPGVLIDGGDEGVTV